MAATAVEQLMKRFLNLYGPPDAPDPAIVKAEYERALGTVSADILAKAGDLLIDAHQYNNWPKVGECVKAVGVVTERINAQRRRLAPPPAPEAPPDPEVRARVAAMFGELVLKMKANATSTLPDHTRAQRRHRALQGSGLEDREPDGI